MLGYFLFIDCRRIHADYPIYHLSVLDEEDDGDRGDLECPCQFLILIYVHFGYGYIFMLVSQLFDDGSQHPAWSASFRPEIDDG